MSELLFFSEIYLNDVEKAGAKGAVLGELSKNLSVPSGFVVSSDVYELFIEKNNLKIKIKNILSVTDTGNAEKLQRFANEIQKLIVNSKVDEELKERINESYENLDVGKGTTEDLMKTQDVFVAVRCSSTIEETDSLSFSDLHATYLNIKGIKNLVKAIKSCWASLFTARAISYREKHDIDHFSESMAVIVQKMISSKKGGLLFTANPVTGNRNEIVIEACLGLSEALVEGKIDADNYIVNKESFDILSKEVKEQEFRYFFDENGKSVREDLGDVGKKQKLEVDEIRELTRIGKKIEKYVKAEQEIEWAFEDKFYILGSKLLTNLPVQRIEEKEETFTEETIPETIDMDLPTTYEEEKEEEIIDEKDFPEEEKEILDEQIEEKEISMEETEPEKMEVEDLGKYEAETGDKKKNKAEEILAKAFFEAGNIVNASDMAITAALKEKYKELFDMTPPNSFNELINELKDKISLPYEDEIKRVNELKNSYIEEYKELLAGDIKFALETASKFVKEF